MWSLNLNNNIYQINKVIGFESVRKKFEDCNNKIDAELAKYFRNREKICVPEIKRQSSHM